jgi:putative membrane protein
MMHWYGSPGGWGYAMMGLGMVVFWGLLVGAVVVWVRMASDRRLPTPSRTQDPMTVLCERYARGEIDETEYRQRIRVLDGD